MDINLWESQNNLSELSFKRNFIFLKPLHSNLRSKMPELLACFWRADITRRKVRLTSQNQGGITNQVTIFLESKKFVNI